MFYDNFNTRIQKEILIRVIKAFYNDELDALDRIPIEMRPKDGEHSRCCIYNDRAILKYRCMAILGECLEDEKDELTPLSEYASRAMAREKMTLPVLTFIHDACKACVQAHMQITEGCHGCFARPCIANCPVDAIEMVSGRAKIDLNKCIKCGKCIDVCPYHAIIRIPIPCEEACPLACIQKDETGKERIDYSVCINCGRCMAACPFGAIMPRLQIMDVLKALKSGKKVVAMVAPAVAGQFKCGMEQLAGAVKKLGFHGMAEVAMGADVTSSREADEFVERIGRGEKLMTSSCCPAYDEAVEKHIPELKKCISSTPTPMHFIGEWVKKEMPDALTVFVGPCSAKRKEGILDDVIDYVLNFHELDALFKANKIDIATVDPSESLCAGKWQGRGFPVTGGTTKAIQSHVNGRVEMKPVSVNGLTAKSIKLLKIYAKGNCPGNFVEVMACEGGCVGGPGVMAPPKISSAKVEKLVKETEEKK